VLLAHLDIEPILDLDMRLGEGSGAVLAMPVLEAGLRIYREMATFAREGLTLLSDQSPERRQTLEDMVSMGDFLAERLPQLIDEWRQLRDAGRARDREHHPDQESNRRRPNRARPHRTTDRSL